MDTKIHKAALSGYSSIVGQPIMLLNAAGNCIGKEDVTGEMAERIKGLVYEYSGRVTLAAAVGVLAIVQHEIIQEASHE